MGNDLVGSIAGLVEQLVGLAAQNDPLRTRLHELALALAAATASPSRLLADEAAPPSWPIDQPTDPQTPSAPLVRPTLVAAVEAPPTPAVGPERPLPAEPLAELLLGRSRPPELSPILIPATVSRATDPHVDLPLIAARCRLKAEGVRWAWSRLQLREAGEEIAERDRVLLDRGGKLHVLLWMNSPSFEVPRNLADLTPLADSFEALAEALALAQTALPEYEAHREPLKPALDLVAEAQSALRVAVLRFRTQDDQDQSAAFWWLRGVTDREGIYVEKHMKLDSPADPARASQLRQRIGDLATRFQAARGVARKKRGLLGRLQHHARVLDRRDPHDENWEKIVQTINALVTDERMPPSSVDLREVLVPILDDLPDRDDLPAGFQLTLREVDDFLATREALPQELAEDVANAEVAEVAASLRGRSVVLIGGTRRPRSSDLLESAFGLKKLDWIGTREHESIDKFEANIAREDVALVLLAIRWSSHSFGEVKRFADRYGKPLVRLPRGYGVNQVAAEIRAQVSHRLGRTPPTSSV